VQALPDWKQTRCRLAIGRRHVRKRKAHHTHALCCACGSGQHENEAQRVHKVPLACLCPRVDVAAKITRAAAVCDYEPVSGFRTAGPRSVAVRSALLCRRKLTSAKACRVACGREQNTSEGHRECPVTDTSTKNFGACHYNGACDAQDVFVNSDGLDRDSSWIVIV
jgi:hypothetical protein